MISMLIIMGILELIGALVILTVVVWSKDPEREKICKILFYIYIIIVLITVITPIVATMIISRTHNIYF